MKSTAILRNAIASNFPLELAYREATVSGQHRTYIAETLSYQPDFSGPEVPENRIELAQFLSM